MFILANAPPAHHTSPSSPPKPLADARPLPALAEPTAAQHSQAEPTLSEQIDREAAAYRDRGDSIGAFISGHLDRLSQLILWTGASTPEDHESRMEVWDDEIRAKHYDQGYEAGLEAARLEFGLKRCTALD